MSFRGRNGGVPLQRCYNCGETGHLAARCSKTRKERREEVKIIENAIENFSLGKE